MSRDCLWSEDEDGNWWTTCKNGFTFTDGGPTENGMRYCCYCGGLLALRPYTEEEEQERARERNVENRIEQTITEERGEDR